MTTARLRFAGIVGIALMGLVTTAAAAPGGGPGGGPSGGGFGGPPGGFGSGFGSPSSRSSESGPRDSDGYDFSGPKFQFSVRKKSSAAQSGPSQNPEQPSATADQNRPGFWTNLKNGFGLFGSDNE